MPQYFISYFTEISMNKKMAYFGCERHSETVQLLKIFRAFYGTRRFITVFTGAVH
jgi:hypothetical protein